MAEFKIPDFLLGHSTDEVHKVMKDILPFDLDVSEGSHSWNLTRPTALVTAELYEFILPEIVKLIWPKFSYSIFLDWHAETRGMFRLNPTAANGFLTATGEPGTIIPEGSMFSTTAVYDEPSVDYVTTEEITLPDGSVTVKAIFESITPDAPTSYSISFQTDGNGTASASPSYATAGTEVTLAMTPNLGYQFKEWLVVAGDVIIEDNKFTMPDGNVTVKAIFEVDALYDGNAPADEPADPTIHSVTVQTDGNGTASASPDSAATGTEIILSATANKGYRFKEWQVVYGDVIIADNKFTMPVEGVTKVPIRCTKTGIVGNTPKHTIVHTRSKVTGLKGVTNEEAITGGTERESDERLQDRIFEYDLTQGKSFVGNIADYKRWATSVDGVGAAVIIPAYDDTGLVTIVLLDANGMPATQDLCEDVYNYIMRPDDEYQRLAPVNAYLSVIPPETLKLCVNATVELEHEATMESVVANLMAQLALYVPEAMEDHEVKYSRVWSILTGIRGVNDHKDLVIGLRNEDGTVEYGVANIPITPRQLPIIELENLELTTGTVY